MRLIFFIAILLPAALRAQTFIPVGLNGNMARQGFTSNMHLDDSLLKKQWSFTRYSGISTSFTFFNGGNATIVSAPVGVQVNRRLNNNLYAFANVTVAPAYINFNRSFINTNPGKYGPYSMLAGTNSLGVYTAASMGLMYLSNDKSFSISGSISIEKSSMPLLPAYPVNAPRAVRTVSANR